MTPTSDYGKGDLTMPSEQRDELDKFLEEYGSPYVRLNKHGYAEGRAAIGRMMAEARIDSLMKARNMVEATWSTNDMVGWFVREISELRLTTNKAEEES